MNNPLFAGDDGRVWMLKADADGTIYNDLVSTTSPAPPTGSPQITLAGALRDLSGNLLAGSISVQLCGFGAQVPRVAGTTLVAQSGPLDVDCPAGTYSFALWGNDQITPGGTFYTISVKDDNGNVVQCAAYLVTGGGTILDISSLTPMGVATVVAPTVVVTGALAVVSYSATPSFNGTLASVFEMTLTGNVTAPTIFNLVVGSIYTFALIQDAIGGRTFTWPANVKNASVIDPTPSAISVQSFFARGDGNLYPIGPMTIN